MDVSLNRIAAQVATAANKKATTNAESSAPVAAAAEEVAESNGPQLKVNDLKANVLSASGINQEKVDRIANAIQSGRYNIDPQRIAERMVASEFDLP